MQGRTRTIVGHCLRWIVDPDLAQALNGRENFGCGREAKRGCALESVEVRDVGCTQPVRTFLTSLTSGTKETCRAGRCDGSRSLGA